MPSLGVKTQVAKQRDLLGRKPHRTIHIVSGRLTGTGEACAFRPQEAPEQRGGAGGEGEEGLELEFISVVSLIILLKGWEAHAADGNVLNPSGGSRDLSLPEFPRETGERRRRRLLLGKALCLSLPGCRYSAGHTPSLLHQDVIGSV